MADLATKNMRKYANKYYCKKCDYSCCTKYLWTQHCSTLKHNRQQSATHHKLQESFVCDNCGRAYKQRSGLWRHTKKCSEKYADTTSDENENNVVQNLMQKMLMDFNKNEKIKDELFEQLQQQNKIIQDMIPRLGNNNNNKFNINVFLNEDCRDAINMTDFIKSLEIQLADLQYTKNNGLIEGVSSVFVNGLKQLDTYKRPIHCTDVKRETLYIKDNNEWDRDSSKIKLKEAISGIAIKQRQAIIDWESKNPDWSKTDKGKDDYLLIVKSVMADVSDEPNENKIIKSIAKETMIDK
tara:strand:+ start:16577 stop:17464 length:888 start_codon:yes stop_codon:yes gene_type:complete